MTLPERIVVLPERSDRPATFVAVADTHSRPDPRAEALIAELRPDVLLHGGDIGDLGVLDRLARLCPALHAVRGNIDGHAPDVPETLVLALHRRLPTATASDPTGDAPAASATPPSREVLRILLTHIAVNGPRLLRAVRLQAAAARADIVVCGHSHVPLVARDGAIAVFNPGSIGPRRFGLPITFGVMSIGDRLSFQHVDCDTGLVWAPRAAAAR